MAGDRYTSDLGRVEQGGDNVEGFPVLGRQAGLKSPEMRPEYKLLGPRFLALSDLEKNVLKYNKIRQRSFVTRGPR